MQYCGIIITGPKGSGKTTIAKYLIEHGNFQIVGAITTRDARDDDEIYEYISTEDFDQIKQNNKLYIYDEDYLGNKYGIKTTSIKQVIENGKIPILIITPRSVKMYNEEYERIEYHFLSIFIDAPDHEIERRLKERDPVTFHDVLKQSKADREYKDEGNYRLQNEDKDTAGNLINILWQDRNAMGMMPGRIIKALIEGGTLLKNADITKVNGASYDLSLGDQYWQDGKKHTLDRDNGFIKLKPGDYVIVSSEEIAELPNDFAARFDLTVGLFCRGVILSNGPQVDPGFRGRLFCLLFNTSNSDITLKRRDHYATIEFIKLSDPTTPYHGKYQGKKDVFDYLPTPSYPSTIVEIWNEIDKLKRAKLWERTLPIILSALAIVATVLLGIFLYLMGEGSN